MGYAVTSYDREASESGPSDESSQSSPPTPVIGFDMGGTSTDVSRFDGEYEHVFEATMAGISIQAPQVSLYTACVCCCSLPTLAL